MTDVIRSARRPPGLPVHLFTDFDGVRLAHLDEGEGPPVLFVHGEPTWSFLWRRVLVPIRDAQAHAADSVLPLETGRRFAAALGGELAHVIEDASHRRTPGPRSAA